MAFDMAVGLFLKDQEKYAQYRAAIAPLLERAGCGFRYDFEVARTLKSETDHDINRVFILRFPDRAGKERFFADPQYLVIRGRLFENAVQHTVILAEYDAA